MRRLALLLLVAVLAAAQYVDTSVPDVDKLWNGADAPMQAVALYPLATWIDLGCAATVSPPSVWTFEALVYQLPGPLPYEYIIGDFGKSFASFSNNGESKYDAASAYFDNQRQPGWKHVVASYDGSTVRIWFNGRLVHQVSRSGVSAPAVIRIFLYGASDLRRVPPLIVAWVKLWSGAASQGVHVDQLARGAAPPGLSLVAGIDYTRWPPATLAGTWDCNGKLFGVPVTRVFGAYVDTAWSEPYSPGSLFGFGWTGSASIAYAHTPTSSVSSWWSITAILSIAVPQEPWIGIGNAGQYGGGVVRTDADNLYATPRGAYAGVLTWVANYGIYYNGTKVASTAGNNGVWAPWWWGLRRGAAPSGVSARAVVRYVWVSNATSTAMPPEAIMVDYRWWPPVSSVGFFGTWAHPAYQVSGAPALVPGYAAGAVSSNTDTWAGGASALLPPVHAVAYNGATNNTGLHFGAAYIWRVASGVSAPGRPIALVPSTYTLTGWTWSGPTPNTGPSLSVSLASGQSVTLYALATAPGAYTFTIGGSVSVSVKVSQGYDTLCTLSGSGTCNLPPGVSLISITATATAATTFTVRITYAPPSGSVTYAAAGVWYGACMPLHHPQVYNGLVTGYYIGDYCSAAVPPMQTTVPLPSTSTVHILVDRWIVAGPTSAVSSAVQTPSVLYTLNVPSVTNPPLILTVVVNGRHANAYAVTYSGSTLYVAARNVLLTRSPAVLGASVYTAGGQAHVWHGSIPGDSSTALRLVTGDLTFVPTLSSSSVYAVVNGPVGTAVRLWTVSSGVFYPLGGGVIDGQTPYVSPWSGTWLAATVRFLWVEPGTYTIYVRNSSTWYYAYTTQLAGQADVVVRFPYPAPYKIEVWRGATRAASFDAWLDQGSLVYVDLVAGVSQSVVLKNASGGIYVRPIYNIANQPLEYWQLLLYVASSMAVAYFMYRRVGDKGAVAFSAVFDAAFFAAGVYFATQGMHQYVQLAGISAFAMLAKVAITALPTRR